MDEASRNGSQAEQTAGQKALNGYRLTLRGIATEQAARMAGTTTRQIESIKGVLARVPEFEASIEAGTLTLNAASTGAGFRQHRPVAGKAFGKGDKWLEVANTITQYLAGWKTRGYEFKNVPPNEAAKRVLAIDEIIAGLNECRADLERRSVRATSSLRNK